MAEGIRFRIPSIEKAVAEGFKLAIKIGDIAKGESIRLRLRTTLLPPQRR